MARCKYGHPDYTPSSASRNRCPVCVEMEERAIIVFADADAVRGRYAHIQKTPTSIAQDAFGICGTTSIVFCLLSKNPARADDLFRATFSEVFGDGSDAFKTSKGAAQRISLRYLARKYQRMFDNYVTHEAARAQVMETRKYGKLAAAIEGTKDEKRRTVFENAFSDLIAPEKSVAKSEYSGTFPIFFVDYCLSRGIGYMFWKLAQSRYMAEKLEFNASFAPAGVLSDWSRVGHLALRTNNLAFILKDIIGCEFEVFRCTAFLNPQAALLPLAPEVEGVKTTWVSDIGDGLASVGSGAWALASVFGDIAKAEPTAKGPSARSGADKGQIYNHWVVIQEAEVSETEVRLTLWTWGGAERLGGSAIRNVVIAREHLASYLQDLVVVSSW